MASPVVERLRYLLEADSRNFVGGLKKARDGAKDFTEDATGRLKTLRETLAAVEIETSGLADAALGALGTAARSTVSALAASTRAAIDQAAEYQKLAQQSGVTVEAYSTLSFAARQNRVSQEQLEQALKGLQSKVREAEQDTTLAAQAFRALGVETRTASGEFKGTEELLLEVADAFSNVEDGTTKGAAAIGLFEESGRRLIPFLNLGKDGIEALREEARQLGLEVSTGFANDATRFSDQLATLEEQSVALGRVIAQATVPELNKLVKLFLDGAKAGDIFKGASDAILTGVEDLARAVTGGALDLKLTVDTDPTNLDRLTDARATLEELEKELEQAEALFESTRNAPAFKLGITFAAEQAEIALARLQDRFAGQRGLVEELENAQLEIDLEKSLDQRGFQVLSQRRTEELEALAAVEERLAGEATRAAEIRRRLDEERRQRLEELNALESGDTAGRARVLEELRRAELDAQDQLEAADRDRLAILEERKKATQELVDTEKLLEDLDATGTFRAPRRGDLQLGGQSEQDAQRIRRAQDQAVAALERQRQAVGDISQAERVRRSIEEGAFREFSTDTQTRLLLLAEELDLQKERQRLAQLEVQESGKLADLQNQLELERALTGELQAQLQVEKEVAAAKAAGDAAGARSAQVEAQNARARLEAQRAAAGFQDEERRKQAEDTAFQIEQERLRRERLKAEAEEAERLRGQQAQAVDRVLQSVQTLEQAEAEEIETIRQLALVNEEVRAVQDQAIAKVREKYRELRDGAGQDLLTMADIGRESAETLRAGFVDLLVDPLNNSFDQLLQKWLQTVQRMAAEGLVQELFGGLGGGGGGGGGGLLGGLFGGLFAEGGHVRGPGTSTSDSIPARLSDGEYVLRAAAVRQYGVGFLHQLNRGMLRFAQGGLVSVRAPSVPRFAAGGIVEAPAESMVSQTDVSLRVVNLLDPQNITDEMAGGEGERVVLNHIRANAGAVKAILGSG